MANKIMETWTVNLFLVCLICPSWSVANPILTQKEASNKQPVVIYATEGDPKSLNGEKEPTSKSFRRSIPLGLLPPAGPPPPLGLGPARVLPPIARVGVGSAGMGFGGGVPLGGNSFVGAGMGPVSSFGNSFGAGMLNQPVGAMMSMGGPGAGAFGQPGGMMGGGMFGGGAGAFGQPGGMMGSGMFGGGAGAFGQPGAMMGNGMFGQQGGPMMGNGMFGGNNFNSFGMNGGFSGTGGSFGGGFMNNGFNPGYNTNSFGVQGMNGMGGFGQTGGFASGQFPSQFSGGSFGMNGFNGQSFGNTGHFGTGGQFSPTQPFNNQFGSGSFGNGHMNGFTGGPQTFGTSAAQYPYNNQFGTGSFGSGSFGSGTFGSGTFGSVGENSFKRSQFNDPTSPYYIQLQPTGTMNHGGLDSNEDDGGFSFGKKRTSESNTGPIGSNLGSRSSTVRSTQGSNSPLRMNQNNEDQEFRIKPHAI